MGSGRSLSYRNGSPAAAGIAPPKVLQDARGNVLMDPVDEGLARRVSLERPIDDGAESVGQRGVLSGGGRRR